MNDQRYAEWVPQNRLCVVNPQISVHTSDQLSEQPTWFFQAWTYKREVYNVSVHRSTVKHSLTCTKRTNDIKCIPCQPLTIASHGTWTRAIRACQTASDQVLQPPKQIYFFHQNTFKSIFKGFPMSKFNSETRFLINFSRRIQIS